MTQKPGIRKTPITALVPHPSNPRQGDVGAIIQSIEANGWYGTLVAQIATGHVLAGNHRLQAAIHCGLDRVPVHWVDVDDDTAHRILLADNRTTDLATYDEHALADLLVEMGKAGNLEGTGYDGDDLDDLLAELERHGPDADDPPTPAPPDDPVTQLGDLILLGNHRLMCGDSSDPQIIAELTDNEKIDCILTDPPYGMNLDTDYAQMPDHASGRTYRRVAGDDRPFHMTDYTLPDAPEQFWFGADWYRHSTPTEGVFLAWDKRVDPTHDAVIGSMFELIWSRQRHQRVLFRYPWTAYDQKHIGDSNLHPTQKPVALLEDILTRWTKPGHRILDPFAGSGATLIAGHNLSRPTAAAELDPGYCDVIVQRWEDHTGQTATRP